MLEPFDMMKSRIRWHGDKLQLYDMVGK